MAHTNHTTNYELPQFVAGDKPTWLGDVNGAMSAIDTAIAGVAVTASGADSKADSAISTANAASGTASDAATLANTANTNASSALTTAGNAATAASAAQSTADGAVTTANAASTKADGVDTKVGALTDLTTTDKTSIVAAINEVNAKPSGASSAEDVTYDNTTSGLTADDVQEAIDELAARTSAIEYSTTEKVIGKWTDGSDLYMKTVALPTSPTDGTTIDTIVGAHLKKYEGYLVNDLNTIVYPLPWATATDHTGITQNGDNFKFVHSGSAWTNYTGMVTLFYTK